jgi:hypothetical protein
MYDGLRDEVRSTVDRQETFHQIAQGWKIATDDIPNEITVDFEVMMNQDISQSNGPRPDFVRMAGSKLF